MKIIDKLISGILCFCTIITNFAGIVSAETNEVAEDEIIYSQDFGEMPDVEPSGWNKSGYIEYNSIDNSLDIPNSVSGVALNATASGSGDRPAYVDISNDSINQQEYEVFEFDLYMNGGVNTCNIFTMGNKQENSYTDLSNTFFALGNGDGVGARNTLRYYNYNTESWISIPDVNEMWLHVNVYVDFVGEKMAFELENGNGDSIGTYGVFYFGEHFLDKTPCFNRIVMSGFRTDGGVVSLNTWMDNFIIKSLAEEDSNLINYDGILPNGILGEDYSLLKLNNEIVLKCSDKTPVEDVSSDSNKLRVINSDIKIEQLPASGYYAIFSFKGGDNGNILVDSNGRLYSQIGADKYSRLFSKEKQLQTDKWYNIKVYVFLKSDNYAYYTVVITGDFGNGIETIKSVSPARNTNNFTKLNLSIGDEGANISFKNTLLEAKERPSITFEYDSTKGKILVDEIQIDPGTKYSSTVPQYLRFDSLMGNDVVSVTVNDEDITSNISIDLLDGGYRYLIPLQDEDIIIRLVNGPSPDNKVIETKEDAPYNIDPSDTWEIRKYASETRTLQISNAKMAYRLYKPVGYNENSDKKYPMVISMRAQGEENTGYDNRPYTAGHIEDVLTSGENAIDFPCFILSPQCYDELWTDNSWTNIAMVLEITDRLIDEFDCIDQNRIYIGGLSGGANATWLITALRPNFFAGAFIMSGSAMETEYAQFYTDTPIWTFYAMDDSDKSVPRTNIPMVSAIQSLGGKIISTAYPKGGHIVTWKEGLYSPVFKWLFSQERGKQTDSPDIDSLIKDYNNSLNANLSVEYTLQSSIDNTECSIQETVLGDIVTDAMKEITNSDIALVNSGDLGTGIESGNVTEEDVLNALPFDLGVSVIDIKGSDIRNLLINALTYYPEADGRFLQVSGLNIMFDPLKRPSQRITSILVNGEPIDDEKTYKVAITSHLLSNKLNNTYSGELMVVNDYYQNLAQMFVEFLNSHNYNDLEFPLDRINIVSE